MAASRPVPLRSINSPRSAGRPHVDGITRRQETPAIIKAEIVMQYSRFGQGYQCRPRPLKGGQMQWFGVGNHAVEAKIIARKSFIGGADASCCGEPLQLECRWSGRGIITRVDRQKTTACSTEGTSRCGEAGSLNGRQRFSFKWRSAIHPLLSWGLHTSTRVSDNRRPGSSAWHRRDRRAGLAADGIDEQRHGPRSSGIGHHRHPLASANTGPAMRTAAGAGLTTGRNRAAAAGMVFWAGVSTGATGAVNDGRWGHGWCRGRRWRLRAPALRRRPVWVWGAQDVGRPAGCSAPVEIRVESVGSRCVGIHGHVANAADE